MNPISRTRKALATVLLSTALALALPSTPAAAQELRAREHPELYLMQTNNGGNVYAVFFRPRSHRWLDLDWRGQTRRVATLDVTFHPANPITSLPLQKGSFVLYRFLFDCNRNQVKALVAYAYLRGTRTQVFNHDDDPFDPIVPQTVPAKASAFACSLE